MFNRKNAPDRHTKDLIPGFYSAMSDEHKKFPEYNFPTSEVYYVTSLLNTKFGKDYTFREVYTMLQEEGIN